MEKHKVKTLIVLFAISCQAQPLDPNRYAPPPPPLPEGRVVGRFQLVEANLDGVRSVLRIDTATGQTWRLFSEHMVSENKKVGETAIAWMRVHENAAYAIMKTADTIQDYNQLQRDLRTLKEPPK